MASKKKKMAQESSCELVEGKSDKTSAIVSLENLKHEYNLIHLLGGWSCSRFSNGMGLEKDIKKRLGKELIE